MPNENDMQAVIDAAREGVALVEANTAAVALLSRDGRIIDLERLRGKPDRKRGVVIVFDAASFNQVLADNGDAGDIAIYIDRNPDAPTIEAVLNGNGTGGAGWGDFRAKIEFRPTPQWLKWKGIDGKLLSQDAFAEFVEDNVSDIVKPAGAQMLEIATYFQATRSTNFRRAVRLSSGQIQMENVENIEAKVTTGQIAVPEEITLALAPMLGMPLYQVPARFRFRLDDGKLKMGIKLQRIEDLMATVLEDVIAKVERKTGISVLDGRAPPATSPAHAAAGR